MRKQWLLSAAVGMTVLAATSTGSAANNPFSDVPAEHWAYESVAQLASKGIIDGYGDATFQGSKNITRYEMAQMVAKAMAKGNVKGEDKAAIDKLAAEFGDELTSLGVRVANLEKHTDNVTWNGSFAQKFMREYHKGKLNDNSYWWEKEFDLNASAKIPGTDFTVHANLVNKWGSGEKNGFNKEESFTDEYSGSTQSSDFHLDKVWVEGSLGKTGQYVKFGQFAPWVQGGFVTDADVKGGSAEHFGKNYKTHLFGGNLHAKYWDLGVEDSLAWVNHSNYGDFIRKGGTSDNKFDNQTTWASLSTTKTIVGAVYDRTLSSALDASIGYYRYKSHAYNHEALNIGAITANYKLKRNVNLVGMYAQGDRGGNDKAWNIELQYKGNPWIPVNQAKLFSAYLGYRYLAPDALIKSNFGDGANEGQKGWEVGCFYNLAKNIQWSHKYFRGHSILNHGLRSKYYSSLSFNF